MRPWKTINWHDDSMSEIHRKLNWNEAVDIVVLVVGYFAACALFIGGITAVFS